MKKETVELLLDLMEIERYDDVVKILKDVLSAKNGNKHSLATRQKAQRNFYKRNSPLLTDPKHYTTPYINVMIDDVNYTCFGYRTCFVLTTDEVDASIETRDENKVLYEFKRPITIFLKESSNAVKVNIDKIFADAKTDGYKASSKKHFLVYNGILYYLRLLETCYQVIATGGISEIKQTNSKILLIETPVGICGLAGCKPNLEDAFMYDLRDYIESK